MSNFFSVRFLLFILICFLFVELLDIVLFISLKYITKDKNMQGVKFKLLGLWIDDYFKYRE